MTGCGVVRTGAARTGVLALMVLAVGCRSMGHGGLVGWETWR